MSKLIAACIIALTQREVEVQQDYIQERKSIYKTRRFFSGHRPRHDSTSTRNARRANFLQVRIRQSPNASGFSYPFFFPFSLSVSFFFILIAIFPDITTHPADASFFFFFYIYFHRASFAILLTRPAGFPVVFCFSVARRGMHVLSWGRILRILLKWASNQNDLSSSLSLFLLTYSFFFRFWR